MICQDNMTVVIPAKGCHKICIEVATNCHHLLLLNETEHVTFCDDLGYNFAEISDNSCNRGAKLIYH